MSHFFLKKRNHSILSASCKAELVTSCFLVYIVGLPTIFYSIIFSPAFPRGCHPLYFLRPLMRSPLTMMAAWFISKDYKLKSDETLEHPAAGGDEGGWRAKLRLDFLCASETQFTCLSCLASTTVVILVPHHLETTICVEKKKKINAGNLRLSRWTHTSFLRENEDIGLNVWRPGKNSNGVSAVATTSLVPRGPAAGGLSLSLSTILWRQEVCQTMMFMGPAVHPSVCCVIHQTPKSLS